MIDDLAGRRADRRYRFDVAPLGLLHADSDPKAHHLMFVAQRLEWHDG